MSMVRAVALPTWQINCEQYFEHFVDFSKNQAKWSILHKHSILQVHQTAMIGTYI